MSWPCISRVCCLARLWNQLDRSDLSVPLTIHNYSDIAEQEVRSVTKQVSSSDRRAPDRQRAPTDGPGTRGSSGSRRGPSYKPREDYHPPGVPFPSVSQYKQDFKPWPIPRKENFPWISRVESVPDSPANGSHRRAQHADDRGHREERCRAQRWGDKQGVEERDTSSYRQEYKPWTGVRSAKRVRRNPPAPGTEATHVLCETSYQAAYSGEALRSMGLGEPTILSARPHVQPAAGPQAGSKQSSSGATRGEEHLVRTKLPPNPSAVFQSGSRVFDI